MKKIFRTALCGLAFGAMLFASACTFFGEEELVIASIDNQLMEDGTTRITITYTDEDIAPTIFYIPKGEEGEEGNGIREITSAPNGDNTATVVTISYTDIEVAPTVIDLPYGTYITGVDSETDPETGDVTLTINFSDPEKAPEIIVLSSGKDGKDGIDGKDGDSITDIRSIPNGDGSVTVVITLSTGQTESFTVPAPEKGEPGKDGREIISITADQSGTQSDPNNIWLVITYSDGQTQTMLIPKNNVWRNGAGTPSSSLGNVGDYYLDTVGCVIYYKETGSSWKTVIDFSKYSDEYHTVTFVDGETSWGSVRVLHGYYFNAVGEELPRPSKRGYEFAGWFTDPDENPNSGQFTDLTVVLSDLTLYAHWVMI